MQAEGPSWVSSGNRDKNWGGNSHRAVLPSGICLVPLGEGPAEPGRWLIKQRQGDGK